MQARFLVVSGLLAALAVACGDEASDPNAPLEIDSLSCPRGKCSAAPSGAADGGADDEAEPPAEDAQGQTSDAGAPSASPPPSTGPGTTDPVNTCNTAVSLGTMDGEAKVSTAAPTQFSARGDCSKWFKIRVNESSSFLAPLEVKATLISPSAHKFDLYAYVNTKADTVSCTSPTASSATTVSSVDNVDVRWGDSPFSDDSRTVTIEVRAKNGCAAGEEWALLVSSATTQ